MVYPALLPLMHTPRLPVVDWTDAPADLNGLVRFTERLDLVSARVPSHFNWPLLPVVDSSWNVMAKSDARDRKWRGNCRMGWVASTLHTTSEHGVSSITTADAHTSAASSRLNWRPANLNGLVPCAERRNIVSARVSSRFNWPVLLVSSGVTWRQVWSLFTAFCLLYMTIPASSLLCTWIITCLENTTVTEHFRLLSNMKRL